MRGTLAPRESTSGHCHPGPRTRRGQRLDHQVRRLGEAATIGCRLKYLREQSWGEGQFIGIAGQGQGLNLSQRQQSQWIVLGCTEVVWSVERADMFDQAAEIPLALL